MTIKSIFLIFLFSFSLICDLYVFGVKGTDTLEMNDNDCEMWNINSNNVSSNRLFQKQIQLLNYTICLVNNFFSRYFVFKTLKLMNLFCIYLKLLISNEMTYSSWRRLIEIPFYSKRQIVKVSKFLCLEFT
jgi:hypothetical protein